MTFTTDADTLVVRDGVEAKVTDLQPADRIDVAIVTEDASSFEEVLATPVWIVLARAAKVKTVLFGFAGRVTALDAAAKTVTVDVKYATKSARAAIGPQGPTCCVIAFLTDPKTDIRKGGEFVGLDTLVVGDLVGVGIRAPKGSLLPAVQLIPARTIVALAHPPATAVQARRALKRLGARAARARW